MYYGSVKNCVLDFMNNNWRPGDDPLHTDIICWAICEGGRYAPNRQKRLRGKKWAHGTINKTLEILYKDGLLGCPEDGYYTRP